jgi:methylsterol monooxygenase
LKAQIALITVANKFYSRNSTFAAPVTYGDYFNDISQYNVHLNVLEKAWAAWYAYMQNDILATGIMSFVMHEIVYFGRAVPFILMDKIPYFRQYKIQEVSVARLHDLFTSMLTLDVA